MNFALALTVLLAVLSVARTARLLVWDTYPPVVWAREAWDRRITGGWNTLAHCAFCATPYLALGMAVWVLWVKPWNNPADVWSADWWWFAVNGTWGLSYVSAMAVAWDQPPGDG